MHPVVAILRPTKKKDMVFIYKTTERFQYIVKFELTKTTVAQISGPHVSIDVTRAGWDHEALRFIDVASFHIAIAPQKWLQLLPVELDHVIVSIVEKRPRRCLHHVQSVQPRSVCRSWATIIRPTRHKHSASEITSMRRAHRRSTWLFAIDRSGIGLALCRVFLVLSRPRLIRTSLCCSAGNRAHTPPQDLRTTRPLLSTPFARGHPPFPFPIRRRPRPWPRARGRRATRPRPSRPPDRNLR